MGKYLIVAKYTADGVKGLMSGGGGTARRDAAKNAIEGVGGTMESFYYAFGEDDVFVTVDVPDDEAAAALAFAVGASGLLRVRTVVLLTPEQIDAAVSRQVQFRGPGQ
jgi:uncharacterized protein with GYD domain